MQQLFSYSIDQEKIVVLKSAYVSALIRLQQYPLSIQKVTFVNLFPHFDKHIELIPSHIVNLVSSERLIILLAVTN